MRLRLLLAGMAALACAHATGAEIVRAQAILLDIPVQGITLSMSAQEAFEHLWALGYRAGPIQHFDHWRSGGIEMVRVEQAPASGRSSVTLSRQDSRLTMINETTNRPGKRFDVRAEIAVAQRHFEVDEEERNCRANSSAAAGVCSVTDGDRENPCGYGLQIFPTMRMVQLGWVYEQSHGPVEHR